jgi:hypothetical protein
MKSVVVTFGAGAPKKGSVRMKAVAVENAAVPIEAIGDYYVSRDILRVLGLADNAQVKVTFETNG